MKRQSISSSNIAEVGYDENSRVLEVQFTSGIVYQYFDVPPQIHAEMMQASSAGQYLNANIKGNFRYARV
jgi:KTSC domain